ncbi:MAG: hypothetical protein ACREXR_06935, partial [Gammaproteobacteria bacterium]
PGRFLEGVLAYVRNAEALPTYDFVDVVKRDASCGWQVKSSRRNSPVTWARAKIAESSRLIARSENSQADLQKLGDAIIAHCNRHVQNSLAKYELDEIGYARLILHPDRTVTYFERLLVTREEPMLFDPRDFEWKWSEPKPGKAKELLPSLHGFNRGTQKKWFAWYGRGENQLHFDGEKSWWPTEDSHSIRFQLPKETEQLDFEAFAELLTRLSQEN